MRPIHRKTTPKVRGGKVQRKNRTALSPSYGRTPLDRPVVDRQRPDLCTFDDQRDGEQLHVQHDAVLAATPGDRAHTMALLNLSGAGDGLGSHRFGGDQIIYSTANGESV